MTAHWVDNDYELKEILLDALEIRGAHTGVNMVTNLLTTLEEFSIKEKRFCVTGDNASNNKIMAREIEKHVVGFEADNNLLGCAGHVFNLAAVAGLSALGYVARDDFATIDEDEERETKVVDFNWGEEREDEGDNTFDPASIVDRVREFCKFVRASPQRRKQFEDCVKDCYSASFHPLPQSAPVIDSTVQLVQTPSSTVIVATTATTDTNGKRSGEPLSVPVTAPPTRKRARYNICALKFLSVVYHRISFLG